MNYVYDILLNFQKELYEFYEWNKEDEITHIRRIPLFKISARDLKMVKTSDIKIEKNFCDKIYNKTEKFRKTGVSQIPYAFLISDGKEVIAIKLDKTLKIIAKSSLLLDEAEEICEMTLDQKMVKIKYLNQNQKNQINFETRYEKETKKKLNIKLLNLYKSREYEKLKYIYFECFRKKENNINTILQKLKQEINTKSENYKKIFNFFKIIAQK